MDKEDKQSVIHAKVIGRGPRTSIRNLEMFSRVEKTAMYPGCQRLS